MFRELFKIRDVNHSFRVQNENVFVLLKSGKILCYNSKRKEKTWEFYVNKGALSIGFLNGLIFCNSDYETRLIDPSSGHIINQYNFEIVLPLPDVNGFLSLRKENGKKILGLENIQLGNVWQKETKLGNRIASLNHVLINSKYLNNQIIAAYDVTNFELLWDFNIAPHSRFNDSRQEIQEGIITNILGIHEDNLWLGISSGKLIELNIRTGKLERELGLQESQFLNFNYSIKEGDYIPWGDLMQLDKIKEQIIGLRDKYFMKIDLVNTQIREYIDVGRSMNAFDINSSYRNYVFPSDENYIYFCDDRQGKIGVFDRNKLEVIWSHELEIEHDGIAQILEMKYEDNRWYVLDRNDVLHIFERV
jgi:hypothetical protein